MHNVFMFIVLILGLAVEAAAFSFATARQRAAQVDMQPLARSGGTFAVVFFGLLLIGLSTSHGAFDLGNILLLITTLANAVLFSTIVMTTCPIMEQSRPRPVLVDID